MANKLTYQEVWETLSKVDCSEHIEKKMNLSYLSWAWAWGMFVEHYPNAQYSFQAFADANGTMHDALFYPDGSASVHVTLNIDDLTRSMWLPVMDYKNNAIANPSARQISDAKMRCLVKGIAMFGLGHYIYAGEDLPVAPDKEEEPEKQETKVYKFAPPEEQQETEEEELPFNYEKFVDSLIQTATKMDTTVDGLVSTFEANRDTIRTIRDENPELYDKLVTTFAKRRSEIENATNEESNDD